MKKDIKVVVVGTGLIAQKRHIPAWLKAGGQNCLQAICDIDFENVQKVAAKFKIPNAYHDFKKMLLEIRPDIVDICTPPATHAQLTIQALQDKSNVLVEKPMALKEEECNAMIAAAQASNRQLCIVHSDLFYPAFLKAVSLFQKGVIGKFRGMNIFLSTPTDYITSKKDHWAHKLPGGVLGETGPHPVYMTLAFIPKINEADIRTEKVMKEYPWSPFEDYRIHLVGNEGVSSIHLIYTTNHWAAEVDIYGSEGMLKVDLESQAVIVYRRPKLKASTLAVNSISQSCQMLKSSFLVGLDYLTGRHQSAHERLIRAFYTSINEGGQAPVSANQGLEAIRVMNLLTEQIRVKG
ncbi:MAG: Gfo/Idh/MocA family oxidoreductase [Candidatus Omnitrophica bacterium]|nr:Gfo/Idh/MocA family oxidoreductase [Candidatus Omnitrophota bacterium]